MNIIVDSCIFISLYDLDDSNHSKAITDLDSIASDTIWITEHILDEVANIFLRRRLKESLNDFKKLIEDESIKIFTPKNQRTSLELINLTFDKVIKQKNKKASYTDLYSVMLIEEEKLSNCKLLSHDHHLKNYSI